MTNIRTSEELLSSIKILISDAEKTLHSSSGEVRDIEGKDQESISITEEELSKHIEGLDLLITEEATLALRAEFLRFSSVFDTDSTRETINKAVVEVTKPLLEAWINRHMASIAKAVIKEAIGKIADVRKPL